MNIIIKYIFQFLIFIIILINFGIQVSFSKSPKIIHSNSPFQNIDDWKKLSLENSNEFTNLVPNKVFFRPKVALVLSGGGSRGIAQISVIHELEKAGIPIDYIVGTSSGAIVGGLYASGYNPSEIESIFRNTDWKKIFSLIENPDRRDVNIDKKELNDKSLVKVYFKDFEVIIPQGLSFANNFNSILNQLYFNSKYPSNSNFDELKIPFRAIATDIVSGKTVALKSGNISTAVRASSTIPLRHTPVNTGDMLLVDGGLMANLPVTIAESEFSPDIIIAVDVTSPLYKNADLDKPWTVADQIISIEMLYFSKTDLEKADFKIIPELGNYPNNDFTNIDTLLKMGQESILPQLESISNKISNINEIRFNEFFQINKFFEKYKLDESTFEISFQGFKPTDSLTLSSKIRNVPKYLALREAINEINLLPNNSTYSRIEVNKINENNILIRATQPSILKNITLINNPLDKLYDLIDSIKIACLGEMLTDKLIFQISDRIVEYSHMNNYSFLEIDSIKLDNETGNLSIFINPGIIEQINISGNQTLKKFLIQRELTFVVGNPINSSKLFQSWENLINTSYFSFVDIYPVKKDNGNYVINVEVVEGGNQIAQIGIRADNERSLQANFSFTHQNIFNLGTQSTISLTGGPRNFNSSLSLINPRILTTNLTSLFKVYYNALKFNTFSETVDWENHSISAKQVGERRIERLGSHFSIGPQIETSGKFGVELRYEFQRIYSTGEQVPKFDKLATFKINFQYDTEDRSNYPTEGMKITTFIESNLIPRMDFISYSKIFFSYSQSATIYERNTLSWGFLVGSGDETMPHTEMFSLGGENNFWGMREDQTRGRQIFNAFLNYTYRIPVKNFFDMYLSVLINSGRTWLTPEAIKLSSFHEGIGTKVSIDTPLGPFSLGVGREFFFTSANEIIWGKYISYLSIGVNL